jgi:hypothetical protein
MITIDARTVAEDILTNPTRVAKIADYVQQVIQHHNKQSSGFFGYKNRINFIKGASEQDTNQALASLYLMATLRIDFYPELGYRLAANVSKVISGDDTRFVVKELSSANLALRAITKSLKLSKPVNVFQKAFRLVVGRLNSPTIGGSLVFDRITPTPKPKTAIYSPSLIAELSEKQDAAPTNTFFGQRLFAITIDNPAAFDGKMALVNAVDITETPAIKLDKKVIGYHLVDIRALGKCQEATAELKSSYDSVVLMKSEQKLAASKYAAEKLNAETEAKTDLTRFVDGVMNAKDGAMIVCEKRKYIFSTTELEHHVARIFTRYNESDPEVAIRVSEVPQARPALRAFGLLTSLDLSNNPELKQQLIAVAKSAVTDTHHIKKTDGCYGTSFTSAMYALTLCEKAIKVVDFDSVSYTGGVATPLKNGKPIGMKFLINTDATTPPQKPTPIAPAPAAQVQEQKPPVELQMPPLARVA